MTEIRPTIVIPLELKATFLRETSEGLKTAEVAFRQLQENPHDKASLEVVGHFFHRLAGTAHSVEYPTLGRLSMICENLSDLIIAGKVSDQAKAIEVFQDGLAAVSEILTQHSVDAPRSVVPQNPANDGLHLQLQSRILIVDDDPFSAGLIDNCLHTAGFVSSCQTNPADTLKAIDDERPDLIILDVEMPGMNGFELCRLIRERPATSLTPVIFVTRKGNVDQRVMGLEVGGNDYISKPFDPQELVARVRSHLQRLAALQDMAIRDGLTRCFNHKYFKIRLSQEVERARRYKVAFSLAMIDIDHFKRVNDTWGHPAGDAVLVHLANLVSASIRSADSLARYGGEEFGVMLVEAGAKEAEIIGNRLCERVSRESILLPEFADGETKRITVTVSIGLAEFRPHDNAQSVLHRADTALYKAKNSGRNRVVVAPSNTP